jgi:predicted MFS family arabinose efflux permease
MMQGLIDSYGFRTALWAWGIILFGTGIISVAMIPTRLDAHSPVGSSQAGVSLSLPYSFLRHPTFYVYGSATMLQSTGYGIPTTYLSTYSRNIALLSPTIAALLLALTSAPGIASSAFFSFLSDNKHITLSMATVNVISAIPSALATLFFWGFAVEGSLPLLCLFAVCFGFFANGYSGAWGGIINDLEREATQRGESVDTRLLYGLLNGLRGIGLVVGGILSVLLLHAGEHVRLGDFAYGTSYGLLILFAGLCLAMGGWPWIWRLANRLYHR